MGAVPEASPMPRPVGKGKGGLNCPPVEPDSTGDAPAGQRGRGVLYVQRRPPRTGSGARRDARPKPGVLWPDRRGIGTIAATNRRSQNACLRRLTHDHAGIRFCRVPRDSDPDWILDSRRAIGERVRDGRMHANLTQEKLEELAGVTRLTIQNIESGVTDARISWLLRIARVLGVPIERLLTG